MFPDLSYNFLLHNYDIAFLDLDIFYQHVFMVKQVLLMNIIIGTHNICKRNADQM